MKLASRHLNQPLTDGLVITVEPIISAGTGAVHASSDGWTVCTDDGAHAANRPRMPFSRQRRSICQGRPVCDGLTRHGAVPPVGGDASTVIRLSSYTPAARCRSTVVLHVCVECHGDGSGSVTVWQADRSGVCIDSRRQRASQACSGVSARSRLTRSRRSQLTSWAPAVRAPAT